MAIHRPWDAKEEDKILVLKDVAVRERKQDSQAFIQYTFIRTFSMPVFNVQEMSKIFLLKERGRSPAGDTEKERANKKNV